MSVPQKPHTVTVYSVTEAIDAGSKIVQAPLEGVGVAVTCFHYPGKPGEHFDQQTGADLVNPETLLCDLGDLGSFAYGYRVVDNDTGQQYVVKNIPTRLRGWADASSLDHAAIGMEELQFAG